MAANNAIKYEIEPPEKQASPVFQIEPPDAPPQYEIEPPDIGTPVPSPAPFIKDEPLTPPSKSYLAETLPASATQPIEEGEARQSLTDFQEGTKSLGKLGGEFALATAKTFNPTRLGSPPSTEELGKIWEPERQAGVKAEGALDVVSNAAQLALAGHLAYQSISALPDVVDFFKNQAGKAGDWVRSNLATIAGGKFNPTSGGALVPVTEEALADLYAQAPVSVQDELRQAARTNDTLRQAIGRVHGSGSASAVPEATPEPAIPSIITPQDLPSAPLVDAVKATQGDMATFAIPGQGIQAGTERMMLAAKKLGEALKLTPANIQAAMTDSAAAHQAAIESGADPDQAQIALNAAFFKRIPLLAAGIPQDMAEGLKAGDPTMVKAYMDQILSDQPVLQEAFPMPPELVAIAPAEQPVPAPSAFSKPEGTPPAPVPPYEIEPPASQELLPPDVAPHIGNVKIPHDYHTNRLRKDGWSDKDIIEFRYTDKLTKLRNPDYAHSMIYPDGPLKGKNLQEGPGFVLDIDHFKSVNDSFGHPFGDKVLKEIGQAIREELVDKGIDAARSGGEEFQVYPNGKSPFEVREAIVNLMRHLATIEIAKPGTDEVLIHGITVSGGFGHTIEDADKALYKAKESGRNQIAPIDKKELADYNAIYGTKYQQPQAEISDVKSGGIGENAPLQIPGTPGNTTEGQSRSDVQPKQPQAQPPLNQPQYEIEPPSPPKDTHAGERGAVANPAEIFDATKAYIEKSRETVPISEDIQHGFDVLQKRGEADELRATQLLKNVNLTPKEAKNITHYLDDPAVPLTERETQVFNDVIKPLLQESDKLFAQLRNEGVPLSDQLHLRRFPADKGGPFDRLLQQLNSVGGRSALLRQTTGGMKKRVMKAMTDEQGNRQVISVKQGEINAWTNKQSSYAGHLQLKKYKDLLEKEIDPLKNKLEKLQKEAEILRSVKIKDPVSGDAINKLRIEALELSGKINRGAVSSAKDAKMLTIYESLKGDIESIQKKTELLENEKEILSQSGAGREVYAKKIEGLTKALDALYNKEIALSYSDLYEQASDFAKQIKDKEFAQEKDLSKLDDLLREIKRLSDIPKGDTLILRDKRLKTLDEKIAQTLAHISILEQSYSPNDLNKKVFIDKQGRRWTLGEATLKEIEKHTHLTYHKNSLLNALTNYNELKKAQRAIDFLEQIKTSPEFKKFAMKFGSGNVPEGWKGTDLPQFIGYAFEPRIADVLNHFNEQNTRGGDALRVIQNINSFLRTTIFFNPLMHIPNIGMHWLTDRGLSPWLIPSRYKTLYKTMMAAIESVSVQNQNYLKMLDEGVNLQYYSVSGERLKDMMLKKMGEEIKNNSALSKDLTAIFGFANPAKLIEAWYRWSAKTTWFANDVAIMQAIFEQEALGKPRPQAVADVSKHIPDYRIPSRVLGSRAIASIMSNPLVTMFSSYHYGALKSYGEMLKSTIKPDQKGERAEALDKMAMLGIILFALYPALDEAIRYIANDKKYKMRRAGSATFPQKTYEFMKGKVSFGNYLQSVLTPSVMARLGMAAWNSQNKVNDKLSSKVLNAAADTVSPVGTANRIISGKTSMKEWALGLVGASREKESKGRYNPFKSNIPGLGKKLAKSLR